MAATHAVDAAGFKEALRNQWDRSARGWDDHTPRIRSWLATATEAMLDMAQVGPGSRVLDVAAGAGDQTLDIARRVGAGGFVLATDISPQIVALAGANVERAGLRNVRTEVADGEALPVVAGAFDAAVCRLGLMFFPQPLHGLREMHRALRPGGKACTVVFSRPERNPCVAILMATALKHAGLPPPEPFKPGGLLSLGKPGLLDQLFADAGFRNVATTAIDAPFRLPSAKDYLAFVRSSASPIQQILESLEGAAAQAAWGEMEERLTQFQTPTDWVGPNELLITAAQR